MLESSSLNPPVVLWRRGWLEACARWAEEGACACACERVVGARLEECKVQRVVISVGGAWVWVERGVGWGGDGQKHGWHSMPWHSPADVIRFLIMLDTHAAS